MVGGRARPFVVSLAASPLTTLILRRPPPFRLPPPLGKRTTHISSATYAAHPVLSPGSVASSGPVVLMCLGKVVMKKTSLRFKPKFLLTLS